MPIEGTNEGAATGVTTGETPAAAKTETVTKADFEAWTNSFASKINGELAAHRKRLEGAKVEGKGETPPAAATIDDVKASREVGKLEALLGDEVIAALGEEYQNANPQEQARLLRVAASLAKITRTPAAETAGQSSRGETPVMTGTARGQAPVPRSPVQHPRTKTEFAKLQRENRPAALELLRDPTFDLDALPFS